MQPVHQRVDSYRFHWLHLTVVVQSLEKADKQPVYNSLASFALFLFFCETRLNMKQYIPEIYFQNESQMVYW